MPNLYQSKLGYVNDFGYKKVKIKIKIDKEKDTINKILLDLRKKEIMIKIIEKVIPKLFSEGNF